MTTMARKCTWNTLSLTIALTLLAATLGCEMGDPSLDTTSDTALEKTEGELSAKLGANLEVGEELVTGLDASVTVQPDYDTCVAGCMNAGGTFRSCHKTCTKTFPIHYQSCMDLCMPAMQSFYQCHKTCNPPKPVPADPALAIVNYKKSYSMETKTLDVSKTAYTSAVIDFDGSGVTDEAIDDVGDGDTDEPEVIPEEPELTPYANCMYWCQSDGGTWNSCHKKCKELVKKKENPALVSEFKSETSLKSTD